MDSRYFLPAFAAGLCCLASARAQEPQQRIEQARQFDLQTPSPQSPATSHEPAVNTAQNLNDDESFGVQQILKRQEQPKPFRLFGEATGFYTSNAALTRTHPVSDAFLVATFGAEYRRALPYNLQFESTVKISTYRYDQYQQLSFNSIDAGAGLTYRATPLWNIDLSARYNFTDLFGDQSGESFFTNHTITLGAQKVYSLQSRALCLCRRIGAIWLFRSEGG